ncbi:hypothetical protein CPB84DRAFT_122709 [Gymnopilus junonius]|uniref:Uncharacterized protein n=1 Tax=Gymnopilus junonius TaxID=109634 RepID=A0A9P5NYK7_GYMJU|nr:hypothetical protein CPB84DRAFT_122709 [Gymnopilus junonius]
MKSSPITELTLSVPDFVTEEELQHYILPNITASLPKLQGLGWPSTGASFWLLWKSSLSFRFFKGSRLHCRPSQAHSLKHRLNH